MEIDRAAFAEDCVRQGVFFRIEPHYLLAVAQLRSGIKSGDDGDRKGPYRLTQAEWDANSTDKDFEINLKPAQISSPARQCIAFGLMAHRAFDAFVSEHARNPSAKELYFEQWKDTPPNTFDADFQNALDATEELLDPAAKAVLDDPDDAPPAIENPTQETTRPVPPNNDKAGAPEWYLAASKEIGVRETGNNSGPNLKRYRTLAGAGADGDPWCAIFVNAMFGSCNPAVPGTRSALARSFSTHQNFVKLGGPALGAVAVFSRGKPGSGLGHVGFYNGENSQSIYVLGGNQNNAVQIAPVKRGQLIGHYWPASKAQPVIAKIDVKPGTTGKETKVT